MQSSPQSIEAGPSSRGREQVRDDVRLRREAQREEVVTNGFGLVVAAARICVPLASVFAPGSEEYEERISGHAARVESEMARIAEAEGEEPDRLEKKRDRPKLPESVGATWADMPVLFCSGCGLRLLGPSWEVVRRAVLSPRGGLRRDRAARFAKFGRFFPPPVGGYYAGRPRCGPCYQEGK